jgi:hypothetical protein
MNTYASTKRRRLVNRSVKLTARERETLERIRARLAEQGLRVSDEKFITALLKAASNLPGDDLMRLIAEGLQSAPADRDQKD